MPRPSPPPTPVLLCCWSFFIAQLYGDHELNLIASSRTREKEGEGKRDIYIERGREKPVAESVFVLLLFNDSLKLLLNSIIIYAFGRSVNKSR